MSLNLDKPLWQRVTFSDVVANVNDYYRPELDGALPYVAGPHIKPGEATVAAYGSTDDDQFPPTFKRKFEMGDVLLHSRGIEKLASVDRVGVTGEKLFVLRTKARSKLKQDFLVWLLSSPAAQAHMRENFTGSVNKFLNWKPLADMELLLPGLDDQKRIADLLWTTERHSLSLASLASRSHAAMSAQLTELWSTVELRPIGDIADCVTGSTPSRGVHEYWVAADVPFYTPSEIESDKMRDARQHVSWAGAAAGRILPPNSVAVACIGGDMGKSAVIEVAGISNQQITSLVGLPRNDAYAVQALLAHPLGRAAMEERETTTIVRKLNKSDLQKVALPWPADRRGLHAMVSTYRHAAARIGAEIASMKRLRAALLADIFGGA